jgi:hypothetical protein
MLSIEIPLWTDEYDSGDKMVLCSARLLLEMAIAANPDKKFTVNWGEPVTRTITFYEPVFTTKYKETE